MMRQSLQRQRGGVMVLVVLSMTAVLAAMGLAFSAGMSYIVKAKLNAATDAAGLAAARAVSVGINESEQRANAKDAAQRFFTANFPANYMMSTATLNDTQVTFNRGEVTINVSASATMPVSFFGGTATSSMSPGVITETKRKDLDMVVALDTSGSLLNQGANVRSSATTFLNQFNQDTDRVGLLHFAYGAVVDVPIRPTARGFDRKLMTQKIGAYYFDGSTASAEGMYNAREQINSVPETNLNRSNLRVIVFFSDGAPNSFGTYLTWKKTSDCNAPGTITTDDDGAGEPGGLYKLDQQKDDVGGTCTPETLPSYTRDILRNRASELPLWYNGHVTDYAKRNDPGEFKVITSSPRAVTKEITYANVNRAARNLVEAMASKSRDEGIYVFTLGLGSALKAGSGVDGEKGEDTLKCMANSTDAPSRCFNATKPVGVYCYAATQADLTPCFSKLASAILRISK